jgi:hypothetical protein
MANELYRLQESQITALGEAKWWALTIYGWLHKFFAGLTSNRPHRVADAIRGLLGYQDDNYPPKALETRLKTIGFFIEQVRIPVEVPWFACGENVSVLSSSCDSAHEGALRLWDSIRWLLQDEVLRLCPELGLGPSPRDAGVGLMPHCEDLRRDLGSALEYDLDGLADAIKRESQAAMEVCNASLISAAAGRKEHSERRGEGNTGAGLMPPNAKTDQGEGTGGADTQNEISALEMSTPQLDRNSGKWVNNKGAAGLEGVETRTLADYRTQGIKNAARTLGRDKDGRVWRREGTPGAHPWYLRSTLRAASK